VHSTQLSLSAPVPKTPRTVPVFLIYAGIIHVIGLALLLPMIITLPGSRESAPPETSVIDIEIMPDRGHAARAAGAADTTAALPAGAEAGGDSSAPGAEPSAETSPSEEEDSQPSADEEQDEAPATVPAAAPDAEKAKAEAGGDSKAGSEAGKKPVRKAKAPGRRPPKSNTKIAPFNGALSGLFAPAPASKRRLGF